MRDHRYPKNGSANKMTGGGLHRALILSAAAVIALAALVVLAACGGGGRDSGTSGGTSGTSSAPKTDPYENLPRTPADIDALIDSIGSASLDRVGDIDRAFFAYWQLSESDREKVAGYQKLQELRSGLQKLFTVREYSNQRVRHDKLLLGACVVYRCDEEHIGKLSEAGIDFVWPTAVNDDSMALFDKYGVGVIAELGNIGLPSWRGRIDGGVVTNPITDDDVRGMTDPEKFVDYPALWGFDLGDEPSMAEFKGIGSIARVCHEYRPELMVYCNLFPNYASSAQLGANAYDAYIRNYARNVDSDIICFDHYYEAYDICVTFENMLIASEEAAKAGRDLWDIIQVNRSQERFPEITADMMRYQAYLSMAYGCKSVMWACWDDAWWYGNVLDSEGNFTPVYDLVKTVDAELEAIEPVYMRYSGSSAAILYGSGARVRNGIETWLEPSEDNDLRTLAGKRTFKKLGSTSLSELYGDDGSLIVAGYLKKNVGDGEAFLFLNSTDKLFLDPDQKPATVTFRTADPSSVVIAYTRGIPTRLEPSDGLYTDDSGGLYTVELKGADAVLVTID